MLQMYWTQTPHRSLNLLTPIEYCSKLLNNKDPSMLQMYWTQTNSFSLFILRYNNSVGFFIFS